MRGGTSKGIVVRSSDLPADDLQRDRTILRLFGSPDRRQIDGLGGADPLTSKFAIVAPPSRSDADLDFTFAQVLIDEPVVDYTGNCGNITAAVAAFAVHDGLGERRDGVTSVRIHCTNTGRVVVGDVPVSSDGEIIEVGDTSIAGVPGQGAAISLDWSDTSGVATGTLMPLGGTFEIDGFDDMRVSAVDIGNLMLIVERERFNVSPEAGPDDIDGNPALIEQLQAVRASAIRKLGMADANGNISDSIPLITLVGRPATYPDYQNQTPILAKDMDIWARSLFLGRLHKAFGIAESISMAAAAVLPGTIAFDATRPGSLERGEVRIGHPSGVLSVSIALKPQETTHQIGRAAVVRTARRIMEGVAFVN